MLIDNFFCRLVTVAVMAVALTGSSASTAGEKKTITAPKAGTPYHALLEGLKLIKAGKYDDWVEKWCHKKDLCPDARNIDMLKKYQLMAANRLLNRKDSCIKGNADTLVVTRINGDPQKDPKIRIFLECDPKSMPRPYDMKKDDTGWKFVKVN